MGERARAFLVREEAQAEGQAEVRRGEVLHEYFTLVRGDPTIKVWKIVDE